MPLIGLGAGAGIGLLKNQIIDKPKQEKERMLAAETARFSPWTGMKAQNPGADTGALEAAVGGGLAGASMGQQMGGGAMPPMGGAPQKKLPADMAMGPVVGPNYPGMA